MAQETLVRAGERAASLAAAAEARRYFEQAAELTDDPSGTAALLGKAGEMAGRAGDADSARRLLEESIELYEGQGDTHAAARVLWRLARLDAFTGRRDESLARMERAFDVISADEPDEDLALLAARLSFGYWYGGDLDRAAERAEVALDIAEAHVYPEALALALRAKSGGAVSRGHPQEAEALLGQALRVALEHDVVGEASVCYFWLSDRCFQRDEYGEALGYLDEALALTRKLGDRPGEWAVLAERTYPLFMLGRWDEAQAAGAELTPEQLESGALMLSLLQSAVEIHVQRGELDEARGVFSLFSRLEESTDVQERSAYLGSRAALSRAEGRLHDALADAQATIEVGAHPRHLLSIGKAGPRRGARSGVRAGRGGEESRSSSRWSRPFLRGPGRRIWTLRPGGSAPVRRRTAWATTTPPSSSAGSTSPSGSR